MKAHGMLGATASIDLLERARAVFSEGLHRSRSALRYLERCGVAKDTCVHYNVGVYDMKALSALLEFRDEDLIDAGLISDGQNAEPMFINAIMIPLYNSCLNTVGFLAQEIPDVGGKAKPHSVVLHKDIEEARLLFGVSEMCRDSKSYFVSCPMEVLCLHSHGVIGAVSPIRDEISEAIVGNVLDSNVGVHFVLPSISEKGHLAKQALDSAMRCISKCSDRTVLFSFLPRPYRHCNAFMASNSIEMLSNVLDKHRDIPELTYRKIGSETSGKVELDDLLVRAGAEFALIDNDVLLRSYKKKLLSLAGYADGNDSKENVADVVLRDLPIEHVQTVVDIVVDDSANQVPEWVACLIGTERYFMQKERCGRKAPKDEKVKLALTAIHMSKGRMSMKRLADDVGLSPVRVRGFIGGLRALLNFDHVSVISLEEETDTLLLDVSLLKSQFKIR